MSNGVYKWSLKRSMFMWTHVYGSKRIVIDSHSILLLFYHNNAHITTHHSIVFTQFSTGKKKTKTPGVTRSVSTVDGFTPFKNTKPLVCQTTTRTDLTTLLVLQETLLQTWSLRKAAEHSRAIDLLGCNIKAGCEVPIRLKVGEKNNKCQKTKK